MTEHNHFPINHSFSHFLIIRTLAKLYVKETTMYQIRAPPEDMRIHTQSEPFLHINDVRAAHPPWCAALFVFSRMGEKDLTT
jgi:hypothetical protein